MAWLDEGLRPGRRLRQGFSLLELLLVLSVIVTALGLCSLSLQGLSRDRQGALAEVRGVLESARATALAGRTDVYVAFETDGPADPERRFRRFALFVPSEEALDQGLGAETENIFQRPLTGVAGWHALPEGLLFAYGAELDGGSLRLDTILDAPEEFHRSFPSSAGNVKMPFFLFNRYGMLEVPPLFAERYHRVGIVEAAYEAGAESFPGAPNRVHLGWHTAGGRRVPRAVALAIDPTTGRARPLIE